MKDLNFPRKWNWLGSRPTRAADIPTWQAIIFGVLIAYTPAAVFIAFILWREGDFSSSPPRRYKPEILTSDRVPYTRLASEIRNAAEHVNDTPLINQTELAQRIQFLNSCKFALVQVGFDIGPLPWAGRVIEDDDNGSEAPADRAVKEED